MQIDRHITPYIIFSEESILHALQKITLNKSRLIFTVGETGVLEGVMTDGDFRRWLMERDTIDLNQAVSRARNEQFCYGHIDDDIRKIKSLFKGPITHIPLVDDNFRLVAVATAGRRLMDIAGRSIGEGAKVFIIAEIGNNHNGSLALARQLIDAAVAAGADCAKFQMRDIDSLYRSRNGANEDKEDLGAEYTLDLLRRTQLSREDMFRAFDYCKQKGILPLCTPWDVKSLSHLESYGMAAYKVASADLTNHHLLRALIETRKPLICSTGMSTEEEIDDLVSLLTQAGAPFVLLHCNSTYPTPFNSVNLSYLTRLKERNGPLVGYSGHERGYSIPIAAVALGAKVVEKHLTLDRDSEGNDHKVSLLPHEFKRMVSEIRHVEQALGDSRKREISQGEMINREVLGKSLVAAVDIEENTVITEEMVAVQSPGQGLPPYKLDELIGKTARRRFGQGDFFFQSDIGENGASPRAYAFNRPWGIPIRYHDFEAITQKVSPDFVEFHLSYKDLDEDVDEVFTGKASIDFTVHCPELFSSDHILDLCTDDDTYRARSLSELARVIDLTVRLKEKLSPGGGRPLIVVNVGGASFDGPVSQAQKDAMYRRLAQSLASVDTSRVELIPQTMPPFPWHFGGQRYHNLFVSADEIAWFCRENKMRVCLDVSHSYLACAVNKWSFNTFIKTVAPISAHLHIADARGPDGEGLQISAGEMDFPALAEWLSAWAPDIPFIPEIWQGHKNGGEGFWTALQRMEAWF